MGVWPKFKSKLTSKCRVVCFVLFCFSSIPHSTPFECWYALWAFKGKWEKSRFISNLFDTKPSFYRISFKFGLHMSHMGKCWTKTIAHFSKPLWVNFYGLSMPTTFQELCLWLGKGRITALGEPTVQKTRRQTLWCCDRPENNRLWDKQRDRGI